MRRRTRLGLTVAAVGWASIWAVGQANATDFLVNTAAEITAAQALAQPGDSIVMADGVWTDQNITFSDNGTAGSPITLRAQTPGRVILNGNSRLTISGDHLIASGLTFKDGALTGGQVVSITSSAAHSRFTNSAIIDYDPPSRSTDYEWVRVDGQENRVDHNLFKGHDHAGITVEVFPSVGSKHQVDNNHFVDRPVGDGNGWETIRIGLSSTQTRSAQALIERNLFERADGELEIISNKTSSNTIRNNTIRASKGTITLRHGQASRVEGNWFMGENVAGTGGIRVIGPDHVVVNNHLQDLDTNAMSITTGYSDWDVVTTATGYEPVDNVLIAHNTMVNVSDQIVTRDAGFNSTPNRTVRPANVQMVNNILWSTSETLIQGTEGAGWTWQKNVAFGTTVGKTDPGVLNVNPQMVKDAQGVWRPVAASPAINNAATGPWPLPTTDIDGQTRTGVHDIGADELLAGPTGGPLSASDVGPSWIKRRTMSVGTIPVPVILFEAENFTNVEDPNGTNGTWNVVANSSASGGAMLKAPGGTRTDLPGTHDAIVEYDVAFNDPGTYFLYVLARGLDSGSNSIYSPATLGALPTVNEALSENGQWQWLELAQYTITAADVNRPLTLMLGKREREAEIDRLLFSPVQLNNLAAIVPEPATLGVAAAGALVLLGRRRRRSSSSRG